MQTAETSPAQTVETGLLPPRLRRAVFGILAVLLTFTGYLLMVRGTAMLLDLSHMAANMFCF